MTVHALPAAMVAVMVCLLAGCGSGTAAPGAPDVPPARAAVTLNVAAAASLRAAVGALTDAYTAGNPEVDFTVTTDSSAALRTQVEQGAPVDVFLAADTTNPQILVDDGLALGDPVPFAVNTIAIVVPADNRAAISRPSDLALPDVRIIAAGQEVPLTAYADDVIANLASLEPDAVAWTAAVRGNVVSREDNAAAVLARIELGEGDAALVYTTDAAAADGILTIDVPADANVRATYAGIVPSTTVQPAAAGAFLDWVVGPQGQAVLGRLGFIEP